MQLCSSRGTIALGNKIFLKRYAPSYNFVPCEGVRPRAGSRAVEARAVASRAPLNSSGDRSGGARSGSGSGADAQSGADGGDPLIALLEEQSLRQPTVQVPADLGDDGAGGRARGNGLTREAFAALLLQRLTSDDGEGGAGPWDPVALQHQQQRQQQQRQRATHGGTGPLVPARMPFEAMYRQLAAFRARHGAAHVPRFCFDAPALGAWARWLRKRRVEGELPQWQIDSTYPPSN
ncbi:hypothetical protein MNEG_11511 [Monoraphidium neglectum]|uniref:Helicase-associated domain-containing protein n=1 Tax=Monoraphidium neglectum TaxID=145388 RepID=A0A0D2LYH3_9CHLO|nr:hypothetical protein MNEG_11511 [Monoraphidium neglectum]KIY96449.1 hypothetical protein MNEG_11511 [Monoraphidium neglectum]|eukprot:XP_013895469.1 hypothetical protein MNEG_11511 [Monoraphidium neglectum]